MASVCVCGDAGGESGCDARIHDVCEVTGSENLVCERFRDDVCADLA